MARRVGIIESTLDTREAVWSEEFEDGSTAFLGLAVLSPLTGAWLVMSRPGRPLYVWGNEPVPTRTVDARPWWTWYPASMRFRSLAGARMALLGGNGHVYRGHTSVTKVEASRTVG